MYNGFDLFHPIELLNLGIMQNGMIGICQIGNDSTESDWKSICLIC
jgi:hypothetical protein